MAKRPTPKKKQEKGRSTRRYASFIYRTKKRIINANHLVECSKCHEKILVHTICPECKSYRGEDMGKKKGGKSEKKITKIQA